MLNVAADRLCLPSSLLIIAVFDRLFDATALKLLGLGTVREGDFSTFLAFRASVKDIFS